MPIITPKQKVNQTKMFGEDHIEIRLKVIPMMIVLFQLNGIQKKTD